MFPYAMKNLKFAIIVIWIFEASCLGCLMGVSYHMPVETDVNPVLLLHGLKDDARKMEPMAVYLRRQGRVVDTISLTPSWGQKGLEVLAEDLAAFIQSRYSTGQKIDLVAFSMGGLVARYYLQRLGGLERVDCLVTISTPHHGTFLAYFLGNSGGRQMRFQSEFLRDLARDAVRLKTISFTSLWTPLDAIILPARSSIMAEADNQKMIVVAHPLMVRQRGCLEAVQRALNRRDDR